MSLSLPILLPSTFISNCFSIIIFGFSWCLYSFSFGKVSSVEIERICNEVSDSVLETAAIGVPPPGGGPEQLAIAVVIKDSNSLKEDLNQLKISFNSAVQKKLNPLFRVLNCAFCFWVTFYIAILGFHEHAIMHINGLAKRNKTKLCVFLCLCNGRANFTFGCTGFACCAPLVSSQDSN